MDVKFFNEINNDSMIVRNNVFVEEQGFIDEFDEIDNIATHIVLYDGQPFATCRVFKDSTEDYIIGRFAVLFQYRGCGKGTALLKIAEEFIKKSGGKHVKIHSQTRAKHFYERSGYCSIGVEDYEECVAHIWLQKELI